jgi:hypothetical protein
MKGAPRDQRHSAQEYRIVALVRRILAVSAVAIVALVACRPSAPSTAPTDVHVSGVAARAMSVVDAGTIAAPCAAKIDRSKSEPRLIETHDPPRGVRVIVRARSAEPSNDVVLIVPVRGGFVEHALGSFGDAECDEKFGASVDPLHGIVHVQWTREHVRLTAMHPHDQSPCDAIGVGDCTLGCKHEGETMHHLFVEERSGGRLLAVEVERAPEEGIAPPEVTFDAEHARVTVRGAGCVESIPLR